MRLKNSELRPRLTGNPGPVGTMAIRPAEMAVIREQIGAESWDYASDDGFIDDDTTLRANFQHFKQLERAAKVRYRERKEYYFYANEGSTLQREGKTLLAIAEKAKEAAESLKEGHKNANPSRYAQVIEKVRDEAPAAEAAARRMLEP